MNRTRQITTFSLLLIAMAPLFFAISFQWQQRSIQHRMQEELKEKMLHTVCLDAGQLNWLREGKELLINDHLFDVHSVTISDDGKLLVTGLYDEEETALVKNLEKNTKPDDPCRLLGYFFQLQLAQPENNLALPYLYHTSSPDHGAQFNTRLPSMDLGVPTPPPLA